MRNMLCLTVYECKGLEFDEVILFNFFQDSQCIGQWNLLNDVITSQKIVKRKELADFLDFEMLEAEEAQADSKATKTTIDTKVKIGKAVDTQEFTVPQDGEEIDTVLSSQTQRQEVYRRFAKVCTELKLLYVAITRPKNLLLIYDEDPQDRRPIQAYWESINLVDVIRQN